MPANDFARVVLPAWRGPNRPTAGNRDSLFLSVSLSNRSIMFLMIVNVFTNCKKKLEGIFNQRGGKRTSTIKSYDYESGGGSKAVRAESFDRINRMFRIMDWEQEW